MSPEERQRQTAAEIARKKVLAAYNSPDNHPTISRSFNTAAATPKTPTSSFKQEPVKTTVNNQDWQKYHSAWQNYYQKYYSEYYAKAAREYLNTEKLKQERAKSDQARLEDTHTVDHVAPSTQSEIEDTLKGRIQKHASAKFSKLRRGRHFIPIMAGVFVVLFILFLQYNRLIFTPIMAYISPGNTTDTGITAIDPTVTEAPSADPRLIIPKLNVDVPVHFGISNDENTVIQAMENGIAHFAIPGANALPGQVGNVVLTGHSSGDVYSSNPYKFIFSGLERLVPGDLIYINYNSVRYTYSVTRLETVEPTDVSALVYNTPKPVLTLITCTPLGTSRYRLLVTAEQINPAPTTSEADGVTNAPAAAAEIMPSNEPSFFERIWNWLTGRG